MTVTTTERRKPAVCTPRMPRKHPPRKRRLRLDSEGRVRIPRGVLDKAKLKPGDAIEIEQVPGGMLLHPPAPPGLAWERGLLVVVPEEDDGREGLEPRATDPAVESIRRMRRERLDKLAGTAKPR